MKMFNTEKIGTLGIQDIFQLVEYTQLVAGDTLFIGSDGKDDLILKSNSTRTINEDEFLFPSGLFRKIKAIFRNYK